MGVVVMSPVLARGCQTLQSRRQNQTWKKMGLVASSPLPLWGVPNASKPGTKSEVGQQVHWCLRRRGCLGGPQR